MLSARDWLTPPRSRARAANLNKKRLIVVLQMFHNAWNGEVR